MAIPRNLANLAPKLSATGGSFATTIGVGAATPAASGAGITFPATQSASSDANTLDDYEEGTFTLTITMNTGTATLGTTLGTYTKIGRQVLVTIDVPIATVGGTPVIERFEGLPFTVRTGGDQAVGLIRESGVTGFGFQGIAVQAQNWISMRRVSDNSGTLQAGMNFFGSITYMV